MKKLISMMAVAAVAVGALAMTAPEKQQKVSDAAVQAAIDSRLHQMLHEMNSRHAQ